MLNLISAGFMIAAVGLMGAGSIWSVLFLCLSFGGFYFADTFDWDIEVLGGMMLALIMIGFGYAVLRSLFNWVM